MKFSLQPLTSIPMAFALLLPSLSAQRIIYDGTRDKTAQDAVAAAKDVTSGSLFDMMLRNMDTQAKREVGLTLDYALQQMRAKLENFAYWKNAKDKDSIIAGAAFIKKGCFSVECELRSMKLHIEFELKPVVLTEAQINQRLRDLDNKKTELEAAIKALKDASKSKDPLVVQAFTLIDENGKDILDYANKIAKLTVDGNTLKGISGGLDEIAKGMEEMLGLYNAVKGIVSGYKAIEPDPASLRPPQEQIDLQLLALEQEHFKALSLIRARAKIDSALTLAHIDGALNRMQGAGVLVNDMRVEKSLADAVKTHNRDLLITLLDALYEAEAALAEEDVPAKLANIRESDESRRYSILRSSVNSSTYDLTIQAASQRLALYWKSGIKTTDVAALVFYLTNTVAIPVIAAK